jgi:hypothetical protein
VRVTLDTGADISIVSADLVAGLQIMKDDGCYRSVSAHKLQCIGSACVPIEIGDFKCLNSMKVMKNIRESVLLGCDFGREFQAIYDVSNL